MRIARGRCFNCEGAVWEGEEHNCARNILRGTIVKQKWSEFARAFGQWVSPKYRAWMKGKI